MEYIILIIITAVSSMLAGFGIGGGIVFVALATLGGVLGQKEAQILNYLLFISVGLTASISNFKKKLIRKKIIYAMLPILLIGALIGSGFAGNIDEVNLKKYFNVFLVMIGIYEIISSLYELKKANNNIET